jgi:hypothetical protein
VTPQARTATCTEADGRARLRTARAYLEVAELVLIEESRVEFLAVATGLAVLAGIAACDALTCLRVSRIHRGQNHQEAADLLERATPDGAKLASVLRRLLDLKDASHYGVPALSRTKATDAIKWARTLVKRAQQESER